MSQLLLKPRVIHSDQEEALPAKLFSRPPAPASPPRYQPLHGGPPQQTSWKRKETEAGQGSTLALWASHGPVLASVPQSGGEAPQGVGT